MRPPRRLVRRHGKLATSLNESERYYPTGYAPALNQEGILHGIDHTVLYANEDGGAFLALGVGNPQNSEQSPFRTVRTFSTVLLLLIKRDIM